MTLPIHVRTKVLPGQKLIVSTPDLEEGQFVDVFIHSDSLDPVQAPADVLDFIDALPAGPRSAKTWEEVEERYRKEREAWDL